MKSAHSRGQILEEEGTWSENGGAHHSPYHSYGSLQTYFIEIFCHVLEISEFIQFLNFYACKYQNKITERILKHLWINILFMINTIILLILTNSAFVVSIG